MLLEFLDKLGIVVSVIIAVSLVVVVVAQLVLLVND